MSQICKTLNTSLLEVSELAIKNTQNKNYFLTTKQEAYFAKKPYDFYIFRELYKGKSTSDMKKDLSLSENQFFKILRSFENLDLLDIYPYNKIKFKISGQLRLNLTGVLFEKMVKEQNQTFLKLDGYLPSFPIKLIGKYIGNR